MQSIHYIIIILIPINICLVEATFSETVYVAVVLIACMTKLYIMIAVESDKR